MSNFSLAAFKTCSLGFSSYMWCVSLYFSLCLFFLECTELFWICRIEVFIKFGEVLEHWFFKYILSLSLFSLSLWLPLQLCWDLYCHCLTALWGSVLVFHFSPLYFELDNFYLQDQLSFFLPSQVCCWAYLLSF